LGKVTNQKDIVLLCEDSQQEVFARQFLEGFGIETRRFIVVRAPKHLGAGIGDVLKKFPTELLAYRKRRKKSKDARLIAIADADNVECVERLKLFDNKCNEANPPVVLRGKDDQVSVFIPKRNIETWIYYILIRKPVDETMEYSKFKGRERKPQAEIREFARYCKKQNLNKADDFPPSLKLACDEFKSRFLGQ
jgi:hypothetical protein